MSLNLEKLFLEYTVDEPLTLDGTTLSLGSFTDYGSTAYQFITANATNTDLEYHRVVGTTDQVIIDNVVGTTTVSTPQNIASTSVVQFLRMGIGVINNGSSEITFPASWSIDSAGDGEINLQSASDTTLTLTNGGAGVADFEIDGKVVVGSGSQLIIEDDVGYYMSDSSNNYIIPNNNGPIVHVSGVTDGVNNTGHIFDTTNALTASSTKIALFRTGGSTKALINKSGDIQFRRWTPNGSADVRPKIADGATAIAWLLNPDNTFTTAGAKLMSVDNGGTEEMYLDKDGKLFSNSGALISVDNFAFAVDVNQDTGVYFDNTTNPSNVEIVRDGNITHRWDAGSGGTQGDVEWNVQGPEKVQFDASAGALGFEDARLVYEQITATDQDTTPSVGGTNSLILANTVATTITEFDDGLDGQILVCAFSDGNTTITDGTNIFLSGSVNYNPAATAILTFIRVSGNWYEQSRSNN